MNDHRRDRRTEVSVSRHSKRSTLQALLFAGAAFGTTLVMLVGAETKIPPFKGE